WSEETGDRISRLVVNGNLVSEGSRFPVLASGGDQALLTWLQQNGNSYALMASRISGGGEMLDTPAIELSRHVLDPNSYLDAQPSTPAVAWTGDSYVVIWTDDTA